MDNLLFRRLAWSLPALLAACADPDTSAVEDSDASSSSPTPESSGSGSDSASGESTAESSTSTDSSPPADGSSGSSSSDDASSSSGASESTMPAVGDDEVFVVQDVAEPVGPTLLANDVGNDGPLTVSAFDAASEAGATVYIGEDGELWYAPAAGFWGTDHFGYTATDGTYEAAATVTVYVAPVHIQISDVADGVGGFAIYKAGAEYIDITGVGDVNGDDLDDALVMARIDSVTPPHARVVFGKPDGGLVDLDDADDDGGFDIVVEGGQAPRLAISAAGDVDGDGLADVIIGDDFAPELASVGRSYVVFGKADGAAVELVDVAAGEGGFAIDGVADGRYSARSVGAAGDLDEDGFADVIVGGGYIEDGPGSGVETLAYVVFGKPDGGRVELGDVALGDGGYIVHEAFGATTVAAVQPAGDVDGDDVDDFMVSMEGSGQDWGTQRRAYVVFGSSDTEPVETSDLDLGDGGFGIVVVAEEPDEGYSDLELGGGGDVNGDGFDDVIVGDPQTGIVRVVFGAADHGSVVLEELGDGGFVIEPEPAGFSRAAWRVANAGDVDRDGYDDVLINNWHVEEDISSRIYVVFGGVAIDEVSLSDVALGIGGYVIEDTFIGTGGEIAGGGDLNGDGTADMLIGNVGDVGNADDTEHAYAVFGVPTEP